MTFLGRFLELNCSPPSTAEYHATFMSKLYLWLRITIVLLLFNVQPKKLFSSTLLGFELSIRYSEIILPLRDFSSS